jgi:hypothetical protein
MEDAKIPDLTFAAHRSTLDRALEVDVTCKAGLNLLKTSTDTTEYLRINVETPTAGNSMIYQAHISVWTQITTSRFAQID